MYKKVVSFSLFFVFTLTVVCGQDMSVIPLPNHYKKVNQTIKISDRTGIAVEDNSFLPEAYFFRNQLLRYTGIPIKSGKSSSSMIILQKKEMPEPGEGSYAIQMSSDKIVISAADHKGIFNGLISLLQLSLHSQNNDNSLLIPCWDIQDFPLYAWRGLMLDESRHFFGKKVVEEILDEMALLKLNRFHWHLTDAPGWRVQIQRYPKLALVGGIGDYSDSLAPAMYYTQDEIREIVAYAKARHIEIIPEIDMPGHATAANRAYPEFSGGGTGKFADFTFNPGKTGTYTLLTDILKEIAVLFPSGIVHLGGDEVSFGSKSWEDDVGVKQLMNQERLKDLKDVEYYFFKRMTDSSLQTFSAIGAWDEATDAHLPTDHTIIFWWRHDKPEQLKKALVKGFNVVLCPRIPLYFDFVQDSTDMDGRRWKGDFSSLKKVYEFSDNSLPEVSDHREQVIGIQANLWTETIQTKKRLEYMLFPRITALAEAAWTEEKNRDYTNYLLRLKGEFPFLRKMGIYFFNPFSPNQTPEVVDGE